MRFCGAFFLILSLVVWDTGSATAENILSGKVTTVIDGNTIEVIATDNETYKISLFGIDCPELGQEFGEKAKSFLQKLILDKNVSVKIQGKDRWGTRLGIVLIDGESDPRLRLLEAGLAWTAERDPIDEFELLKERAREKGKGLWKEQDPTPPWIFRRQQTMTQLKSS
jgi:endonuclease YncB( thermonuclease family)